MSFEQNSQVDITGVESVLNSLFKEIADTHVLIVKLRKEKKIDKVEETQILLDGLTKDYNGLSKVYTSYVRMKKINGNSQETSLAEMARLLQEIKSNVGGIVQSVPVQNKL